MIELPADTGTCPFCSGALYLCTREHTDGPGARLHCRTCSSHNYIAVVA